MRTLTDYCHRLLTPCWTYITTTYKKISFKLFAYPIAEAAGGYVGNHLADKALQVLPSTSLILLIQSPIIYKTRHATHRACLVTATVAAPILYSYLPEEAQENLKPLLQWLFYLPLEGLGGYLFRRAIGRSDPHTKSFLAAKITGRIVETLWIPDQTSPFIAFPLTVCQKMLEIQAYTQEGVIPFESPSAKSETPSSWPAIVLLRCLGKEAFEELKPIFKEEKEKQLPAILDKLNLTPTHPLSLLLNHSFYLCEKASQIHKSAIWSLIFSIYGELRGIEGGETLALRSLKPLEPYSFSLTLGAGCLAAVYALKTNRIAKKIFLVPCALLASYLATAPDHHEASKVLVVFATTTSLGILGGWTTLRLLGNRIQLLSLKSTEFASTYGAGMARLNLVSLCFKLHTPPSHPLLRLLTNATIIPLSIVAKTVAYNTHHIPSITSMCSTLIKSVKNGIPQKALISSILNHLLSRYYGEFKPHIYPLILTSLQAQQRSFGALVAPFVAAKTSTVLQKIVQNENMLVPFVLRSLAAYSHLCTSSDMMVLYKESLVDLQKLERIIQNASGYNQSVIRNFPPLPDATLISKSKDIVRSLEDIELSLWGFSSLSIAQKNLLEKTLPLYLKYYFFFILQHPFEYQKALLPVEEEAIFSLLLDLVLKASPSPAFWILKTGSEKILSLHRTHVAPTLKSWLANADCAVTIPNSKELGQIEDNAFQPPNKQNNLSDSNLPSGVDASAFQPSTKKDHSSTEPTHSQNISCIANYFQ